MFRYLAFVWHDHDPAARDTARRLIEHHSRRGSEWQTALTSKGLHVTYAGARPRSSEPYLLDADAGVVLGRLFMRAGTAGADSKPAPLAFGEQETRAVVESGGRRLVERYWGRYVAFVRDPVALTTWVLRDPSAGLSCVTVRFGGVDVYCSLVEDLLALGLGPFEINWPFLAASVCMMRQHCHGTGLREVSQVLGGECVELKGDRLSRSFYWNAVQVASTDLFKNADDAAHELRRSVRDTVHAWASGYEGILLSLSGGLDSSIVFSCLREAPSQPRLTFYHHYPITADLDERRYARIVARSGNVELIEHPRQFAVSLEPMLRMQLSHEPANYLYPLETSRLEAALASEHGAEAVFNGWGGDQLFFQDGAFWAAGDYLVREGFRPGLFGLALDAARIERVSVWNVLYAALAQFAVRRRWNLTDDAAKFRNLIRPEVVEEVRHSAAFMHPLLRHADGIPSGKLWQLHQLLCGPWECDDPFGAPEDPDRVAPLYSQPILELSLRTPVYLLVSGGWDRAIARRAFQADIPREILNRRHKGGIEDHVLAILKHNLPLLRELLINGALVREGIIDRTKLIEVLSGNATRIQTSRGELYDYFGIEAWLRRWGHYALRAAA